MRLRDFTTWKTRHGITTFGGPVWGAAMAVFYLNVRFGDDVVRDTHIYTFATAQAARDATERTVRQMIVAQPDFALYDKRIEITDAATGHAVTTVWAHDVHPELCHTPTRGEDWF